MTLILNDQFGCTSSLLTEKIASMIGIIKDDAVLNPSTVGQHGAGAFDLKSQFGNLFSRKQNDGTGDASDDKLAEIQREVLANAFRFSNQFNSNDLLEEDKLHRAMIKKRRNPKTDSKPKGNDDDQEPFEYTEQELEDALNYVVNEIRPTLGHNNIKLNHIRRMLIKARLNTQRVTITIKKNIGFYRHALLVKNPNADDSAGQQQQTAQ